MDGRQVYTCGMNVCTFCLAESARTGLPPYTRVFYDCKCGYATNCRGKYLVHIRHCESQ